MRTLCLVASRFLGLAAAITFVIYIFADLSGRTITFPYIPVAIGLFILGIVFAVIEQKLFDKEPVYYRNQNPDDPDWNP